MGLSVIRISQFAGLSEATRAIAGVGSIQIGGGKYPSYLDFHLLGDSLESIISLLGNCT